MAYVKTVNFENIDKSLNVVAKNIDSFSRRFRHDVEDILISGAQNIRKDIIKSMRNTKKNMSKGHKRGSKFHYPSLPGNPPAIDTGELVGSIQINAYKTVIEIGTTVRHGKELELQKNRPWLEPAIKRGTPAITNAILNRLWDIEEVLK